MAKGAPIGNEFWKQRSKHGRDKLFATPELMWEAACEYFEWCNKNPWIKYEAIKSGDMCGQLVEIPTVIPYTMEGLCGYLDCNKAYFSHFEAAIADKDDQQSKDFSNVITRIRETLYQQKFTGASVGAFNASIIARDLGLTDKQDLTTNGKDVNPTLEIRIVDMKNHPDSGK